MKNYIFLSLFLTLLMPALASGTDYTLVGTYTCSADGVQCWNPSEEGKSGVVLYQTNDPWEFTLDPGENVQLKFQCTADHINNVHLDKNSHVNCNKHKDDKRNWHFNCTNKSDDSHHHLNAKSFHCGPNTDCSNGECGGGDYSDPAEGDE
jgi:hypothetical protein